MTVIREARLEDAPMFPAVEHDADQAFRQWPGLEWIAQDDVQSVEQHEIFIATGLALVAEEDGVVGFLNGEFADAVLHVRQLAVLQRYQGRGIGRQLMEHAEETARRRSIREITISTFRNVPWNETFYHKLGYRTLEDHELDDRLKQILEREGEVGLPVGSRCAMSKELS